MSRAATAVKVQLPSVAWDNDQDIIGDLCLVMTLYGGQILIY